MQTLIDRQDVVDTITKLFVFTDTRRWGDVKALFADKVDFDMTSLAGGAPVVMTPDAITAAWDAGLKPIQSVHHQAGNFLVTIEGDRATASCYGIASHYRPNPTGRNVRTFVGSYDFRLVRKGTAWRIEAFRFNCKYVGGNLDLERA